MPACLPVGDGTRQRRTVGCKMEVMVSLSFSSKYYQLVHINKFLLNEHQLPCLSSCFPDVLIYLLLMSQVVLPSQSSPSHVPVTPGHGFIVSTPSAQFLQNCECIIPTYSNSDRDSQHGQGCP